MNEEEKALLSRRFQGTDSRLMETDPEWVEITANFSGKEVPEKSRLTRHEQMLCILSALLGCQGMGEFRHMLHAALNEGLDPVSIKEVIYQATAYLGIGRVHDFLETANAVFKQHGISLPLASQSTTDAASRFDRGLEKQVSLFGPDMAKRQTDGPVLRQNINRWLADNCFGDYYTRTGLDLKQREMITFCFLAAQGGCEPQLTSHAKGNMNLGNDKEFLIRVISQCLPYIGYPRSLNAMGIIDETAKNIQKAQGKDHE